MPEPSFEFRLCHVDANCGARRATFVTPHGSIDLPAFMPVGTAGTVKGMTGEMLRATGAQMILGNTYHLTLRPGEEVVAALGGLHAFMGWSGPILTDSGGFQLFSLAHNTQVQEHAALFRSHIDGRLLELSPERAIQIQEALGSDVAMVLDHVVPLPCAEDLIRDACARTIRWAERCRYAAKRRDQCQFAIVHGGLNTELRIWCAEQLARLDFRGYAIGGLSVGENPSQRYRVLNATCPALPADKPRYLMGVGMPHDILEAIGCGVDMFDCVLPTRNARNAYAFTNGGPLRMRNASHERVAWPLEEDCPCATCQHYSRGYIRHLFMANEMLGPILLTVHNLTFYQRLMAEARRAIEQNGFLEFAAIKSRNWTSEEA